MKFFKNILAIVLLFFVFMIIPKSRSGGAITRPAQPVSAMATSGSADIQQPAPQPTIKSSMQTTPVMQEKSYKDVINFIKKSSNAWDNRNAKLDSNFISIIIKKANQLDLDNSQLESLLQTARDMHGIFPGNQNKDIAILNIIEGQIETAIKQR